MLQKVLQYDFAIFVYFRLKALDTMTDKGQEQEQEFNMELPPQSCYCDIHTDTQVPNLPFDRVERYFISHGKDFEKKYETLYTER